MISDPDERQNGRIVAIAFVLSIVVHVLLFAPFLWMLSHRLLLHQRSDAERFVVTSTSVRIERRTVPLPQHVAVPHPPRPQHNVSHVAAAVPRRVTAAPHPRPTELARFAPSAPPQPKPARERGIAAELAREQTQFSREVARIHDENNPMSIATTGPLPPPSSYRKSYVDIGGRRQQESAESLLLPLKHWYDGGMSCYYVRYTTQFIAEAPKKEPFRGRFAIRDPTIRCFRSITRTNCRSPIPHPVTGCRTAPP